MNIIEAREEYNRALKAGHKEHKELLLAGKYPYPTVLDNILPAESSETTVIVGLVDIPAKLIVGTKSSGRITAFNQNFPAISWTFAGFYSRANEDFKV